MAAHTHDVPPPQLHTLLATLGLAEVLALLLAFAEEQRKEARVEDLTAILAHCPGGGWPLTRGDHPVPAERMQSCPL